MEPSHSSEIAQPPGRKAAERGAIREQLERMLADPLFKHSKRYPNLLRYIVERTLEDGAADLKERTLGIAVFGREPSYDTSTDPVVRATAGEIRKRIAQYYQEPGHENEIRIGLSPGSYVPEFTILPVRKPASAEPAPVVETRARRPRYLRYTALAIAAAAIVGVAWFKPWMARTALDRFWRPVLDSSDSVLLCTGQRRFLGASPELPSETHPDVERVRKSLDDAAAPISLFTLYYMGTQNVAFPDVVAFGQIAGLLRANGKTYHLRGENSTSFADLRDGPVILIGAFNNDWTMRLMGPLRFNFERDGDTFWLRDRQNPSGKERSVQYSMPYMKLTEDFALISRALEPTTERMVVIAGGLTGYGTMAAAEFLTNPSYMEAAIKHAPKDWQRKNVQFVIATKVINGNSGPPRVVDQYFW